MEIEPRRDLSLHGLYRNIHHLQLLEEHVLHCVDIMCSHASFRNVEIFTDGTNGDNIPHKSFPEFPFSDEERKKVIFLKNTIQNIDELRGMLRNQINFYSRPHLRQLYLLDLPDEILIHICEYVQGQSGYYMNFIPEIVFSVKEVKNMRLTCRRLCKTSSHLLVSSINVNMDAISLSRLDEISRHPSISRGVRAIRLNLLYYDSLLGEDVETFIEYHARRLLETTECIDDMASHDAEFFLGTSKENVDAAIHKGLSIGNAWLDFFEYDDDSDEEETGYRKSIIRAYLKYRKLYREQENLLRSGTFYRSVATAMARMRRATRLDVCNAESISKHRTPDYISMVNDEEILINSTLLPITWEKGRRFELGEPPQDIIFKLPKSIRENGVYLNALCIRVPPSDFLALASNKKGLDNIKTITQRLESFSYDPRVPYCSGLWAAEDSTKVEALEIFLSAHLNSRLLKDIHLSCDFLRVGIDSPWFSLGRVLTRQSWQNLERISLTGLAFNLSELEQFINQLHQPVIIWLKRVHLLAGTWARALDILRGKVGHYPTLEDLSGAEFDDMSEQEKKYIMGKEGKYESWNMNKAERHILPIFNTPNPFRNEK